MNGQNCATPCMRIELDASAVARRLGVPAAVVKQAIRVPGISSAGIDDRAVADAALVVAREDLRSRRVMGVQFERRGANVKIWALCA